MADKYPSTNLPQTNDPQDIQKGHLDLLDKINKTNADAASAASAAQAASAAWTKEVVYTPTFTNFGTPTQVNFTWTRVGNRVKIMGIFNSGTTVGAQAKISLPNGILPDDSLLSTFGPQACGIVVINFNVSTSNYCLISAGNSFIQFGIQQAGTAGLTPCNASSMVSLGNVLSLQCEMPIKGWQ